MGVWSDITGATGKAIGFTAKNAVKVAAGYAIGNAVYENNCNSSGQETEQDKSGMAGLAGVAGTYAVTAGGKALINKIKDSRKNAEDPSVTGKIGSNVWSHVKKLAIPTFLAFMAWQVSASAYDKCSKSKAHEGEVLQTDDTVTSSPAYTRDVSDIEIDTPSADECQSAGF